MFDPAGFEFTFDEGVASSQTSHLNGLVENSVTPAGPNGALMTVAKSSGDPAFGVRLNAEQTAALVEQYLQLQTIDFSPSEPGLATLSEIGVVEPTRADVDGLTGLGATSSTAAASELLYNHNLGTLLGAHSYDGRIANHWWEVYSFTVDGASDLEMSLEDAHTGQVLWLFEEDAAVEGGAASFPQFLAAANGVAAEPWNIRLDDLAAGQYHAVIMNAIAQDEYALNIEVNPLAGLTHHQGDLRANAFELQADSHFAVYSGEGNVEFGEASESGLDALDHIDFGHLAIDDVTTWNPVTPNGGGQLYDPGDGLRLFDALELSDGRQILFEGIDRLQFADGHVDLIVEPNDEKFGEQWNLHMTGTHNAWRFTQGSPNVRIGIQDDGLEISGFPLNIHPDLDRSRIEGSPWKFSQFKGSHGTGVHGIIAANSNNANGMSGINWESSLLHRDVSSLESANFRLQWIPDPMKVAEATENMVSEANQTEIPSIINMSLSLGRKLPELEALIEENQDNALFIVASGNTADLDMGDLTTVDYPANLAQKYENVVAVGASWGLEDNNGQSVEPGTRASYSNYGNGLSLMAPTEVISTRFVPAGLRSGRFEPAKFDYDEKFNGTSAAAPHVTGIASLVWSVNPDLSATSVHRILKETAYDLSALGTEFEYGNGLVDADAALRRSLALTHSPNTGLPAMSLRNYATSPEQSLMGIAVTAYAPDPVEAEATEAVAAAAGAPEAIAAANSLPTLDWNALPELDFDALPELDFQPIQDVVTTDFDVLPELNWNALPELDWNARPELDWDALPNLDWDALPELSFQPVQGLEALTAIARAQLPGIEDALLGKELSV